MRAADGKNMAYYDVPNLLHGSLDGAADNNNRLNMPDNRFWYLETYVIDTFHDVEVEPVPLILNCRSLCIIFDPERDVL